MNKVVNFHNEPPQILGSAGAISLSNLDWFDDDIDGYLCKVENIIGKNLNTHLHFLSNVQ